VSGVVPHELTETKETAMRATFMYGAGDIRVEEVADPKLEEPTDALVTLTGGPAPVRAYIEELLPEVLDGRLEPGKVFDRTVSLDDVPAGYRAMDERESIKVLVKP